MVHRSIIKYDTDIQQDLFSNIILAGGQLSNSINTKGKKARLHVLPKNLGVRGSTMGVWEYVGVQWEYVGVPWEYGSTWEYNGSTWEYHGSMGVRESRFFPRDQHTFIWFFFLGTTNSFFLTEPDLLMWRGGTMLTKTDSLKQLYIKRNKDDEYDARIINVKCL
jgi:actin-related protein